MDDLRHLFGPPGSPGTPGAGPGSPDGPHGPGVLPGGGGPAAPAPAAGAGLAPLMDRGGAFDPVRVWKSLQLAAEVHNSLVNWGILILKAGEPPSRRWVIDPNASPVAPGSGLTGTFQTGPFGSEA